MTALEKRKRLLERKSFLVPHTASHLHSHYPSDLYVSKPTSFREKLSLSKWMMRNKRSRHMMVATPAKMIQIDATTLAVMKLEVEDLLLLGRNHPTSSSINSSVTQLALANALLGSRNVLDVYAESGDVWNAAVPINNNEPSVDDTVVEVVQQQRRFGGLSLLRKKRASAVMVDPETQRRYNLVNALNRLQQQTGASTTRIASWEEAVAALSTVLQLPDDTNDNDDTTRSNDETNETYALTATTITTTTTIANNDNSNANQSKKKDAVESFVQRLRDIRLQDVSPPGLRVSQLKWLEIANATTLLTSSAEAAAAAAELATAEKEEQKRTLDQEYAAREERLQSQAVREAEEQWQEREREQEARDRASALLRPLLPDERQRIRAAMDRAAGPDTEVIAVTDTDSIQRASLRTLLPHEWLNDEVIHYFLVMLSKRDEQLCRDNPGRKRTHFFKSFFVTKLRNEGNAVEALDGVYCYANVKRWSKKVPGKDIFNLNKIVFPINQGNQHWTSAVAFMQEQRIQYYDSMGGSGMPYLRDLLQYLKDEHQDKKKCPLPGEWTLVPCTRDTPRQLNGYDCGVFTCMFADFISKDCPLVLGQDHITQCRERIALSILQGTAVM